MALQAEMTWWAHRRETRRSRQPSAAAPPRRPRRAENGTGLRHREAMATLQQQGDALRVLIERTER